MNSLEYWEGVFIGEVITFVESQGKEGEMAYITWNDKKKHTFTWGDFVSEALLHLEVQQALTMLLNSPTTANRNGFNRELVCLANRLYMVDVAEYNLNRFLEG